MSRILFHSGAPWVPTGYGTQCGLFARRFQNAGHDVAVSATWGLNGAALEWEGIPVYPGDDLWGNVLVPALYERHQADLLITLLDVWVLNAARFRDLNTACWVPVDHFPCPPRVQGFFHESGARPVAMSRFGVQMLQDKGLNPLYVPHGIDTQVFAPPTHDRADIRESVGIPRDAFVVGMVANNHGHTPPRKAFGEALMAFANFQRTHEDAFLYLHAEMTGTRSGANAGINLPSLCDLLEIPADRVGFAPQVEMELDFPAANMAALYGAMDVLLNPSYGEGFGIPIVEAQSCGTPVVVGDWTSMPELCGAGWKVDGQPWFDHDHGSFFFCPAIGSIIEALDDAYDNASGLRERAREFAVQYDADLVMDRYWTPVLDELTRPREVGPLPNRAMRRKAKQKAAA